MHKIAWAATVVLALLKFLAIPAEIATLSWWWVFAPVITVYAVAAAVFIITALVFAFIAAVKNR